MKRVLFDLECSQPNASGRFHGGGEYTKIIFEYLVKNYNDKCEITTFYNPNAFCEKWIIQLIEQYNVNVIKVEDIKDVEKILKQDKYDVLFCGLANKYIDIWLPDETYKICTIHGLRAIEYKEDRYSYCYAETILKRIKF